jgi:hypothetical protein
MNTASYKSLAPTMMDESLWYLDYYDAPRLKPPPRRPTFLNLPNELLVAICQQLKTNRDVCQFSLVSQRLRDVAQLVLVKPVKLPHHGIRKFVQTMVDRPDLVTQVKEVDLGDFGCENHVARLGDFDEVSLRKCEEVITELAGVEQWSKLVAAKATDQDDPWGRYSSFCLAILTIIAPNLEILSTEPRPLGNLPPDMLAHSPEQSLWELQLPSPLFQGPLLEILQNRIEQLTLSTEHSCFKGIHMRNITFAGFTKLKRLTLLMKMLIYQGTDITNLEEVLPSNLECLEIQKCNIFVRDLISKLLGSLRQKRFLRLRRLKLHFHDCLRSSLVLMGYGNNDRTLWLSCLLDEMTSKHNCMVTAYAPSDPSTEYETSDLLSELQAQSLLSPAEAWIAATKGQQFTTTVARNDRGAPRARTILERKIVLKNYHVPSTLLSSPTFDGTAWEKVVFFRGLVGTKAEFDQKKVKENEKGKAKSVKGGKDGKSPRSSGH